MRRAVSDTEKQGRRTDILAAAKKVFARKGYHATTIADIAKAAKLSYGSIYWYFDSKDALFHALMEAEGQALRDHVTEAMLSPRPGIARCTVSGRGADHVRVLRVRPGSGEAVVPGLLRARRPVRATPLRDLRGVHQRHRERSSTTPSDRGLIIEAPPRMVACSVAALVGQIAHRRLVTDDGLSAEVAADFVVSLLLNGLLPR